MKIQELVKELKGIDQELKEVDEKIADANKEIKDKEKCKKVKDKFVLEQSRIKERGESTKKRLFEKLTEEISNQHPELKKNKRRLEEKIKHVANEEFIKSLKESKANNALMHTLETLVKEGEITDNQSTYHFGFSKFDEKNYNLDSWVEHATNQYSLKKRENLRRFAIKAKNALTKEEAEEKSTLEEFLFLDLKALFTKVVALMKKHGEIQIETDKNIEFVDTEVDKLNDTLKESCLDTLGNQHGLNDKEVLRYMVNVMLNMKWNDWESKENYVFAEKDIESKQAGFNKWVLGKLVELEYIKEDVREKGQYKFRFPRKFTQRKDSLFKKYKKWREDIVKDLAQKCNLSSTATRLLEKHAALIYEHKEKEGDNKTPLERLQLLLHREKNTIEKKQFEKELMEELEKQGIILNEAAKTLTGINKAEDDEFIATLVSALSEDITPKPDAEQLKQKVKRLLKEDPSYLEIIYEPDFYDKVGGYSESKGFYTLSSWIKKKEAREEMIKEMVKVFPKDAKTTEQLEEAVKELWRKTENDTSRPNINGDSNIDEYNTLKTWTIGKLEEEGKIKVKRGKKRSIKKVSLIDPNSNEAHIKRTTTLGAARKTGIFGTLRNGRQRASSSVKKISLTSTGLLRRSRRTSAAEVNDQSKKKSSALSFKLRSPRTLREKPVDGNDFFTPSNQPPVTQQGTLGKRKEKKKIGCKRPSTTG